MSVRHHVDVRQARHPEYGGTRGGGARGTGGVAARGSRGDVAQSSMRQRPHGQVAQHDEARDSDYYTDCSYSLSEPERSVPRHISPRAEHPRKRQDEQTIAKPRGSVAPAVVGNSRTSTTHRQESRAPSKKSAQHMESRAPAKAGSASASGNDKVSRAPAEAGRSVQSSGHPTLSTAAAEVAVRTVVVRRRVRRAPAKAGSSPRSRDDHRERCAPAEAASSRKSSGHPVERRASAEAESSMDGRSPRAATCKRGDRSRSRSRLVTDKAVPQHRTPNRDSSARASGSQAPVEAGRGYSSARAEAWRDGDRWKEQSQQHRPKREDVKLEPDDQHDDCEDDDDELVPLAQMVIVADVMSWEVQTLKKLPAVAVMVGMSDSGAQKVLGKVGLCRHGMICCDGILKAGPRPTSWPCIAASNRVYSSCSVVDRLFWHQKQNEPAEGFFIAQLGCRSTVCGATEMTIGVFACGPHTSFDRRMCDRIAQKMAVWGLHICIGIKSCDQGTRGDGELAFQEHIPFVEQTLRLPPMAHVRTKHFTNGGSVVWACGREMNYKTVWFLHDIIRCKKWETGTIARCGPRDSGQRSAKSQAKRWTAQQARMQDKPWKWGTQCPRADPVRHVMHEDADF